MSDLDLTMTSDSSGVNKEFDAVAKSAESMAAKVAAAGKKAGDGIKSVGSGSEVSAKAVERSSNNMVSQLKRLSAETQASAVAAKGSAAYYEALARARGLDMAKIQPYVNELKKVETAHQSTIRSSGLLTNAFAGLVGAFSIGATFRSYLENTKAAEAAQAQLGAVIRSTGAAAGWTQSALNDMARTLSDSSTFSSVAINEAQTRLLSYSGIVGDEFPRAMQIVIDQSQRMGMSLTQSAEIVGKALDIPSKGLGALSKQGFRFSEDTKKVIEALEKTGKTAEAQAILMEAMESSYEGAAQAARNTLAGAMTALKNAFGDAMTGSTEQSDQMRESFEDLIGVINDPQTREAFTKLAGAIATVVSVLVEGIAKLVQFAQGVGEFVAFSMHGPDTMTGQIQKQLKEIDKEIATYQRSLRPSNTFLALGELSSGLIDSNQATKAIEELRKQREVLEKELDYWEKLAADAQAAAGRISEEPRKPNPKDTEGGLPPILTEEARKQAEKDLKDYQSIIDRAAQITRDASAKTEGLTTSEKALRDIMASDAWGRWSEQRKQTVIATYEAAAASEKYHSALQAEIKAAAGVADSARKKIDSIQEQIKYYGLTEDAINRLKLAEAQANLDEAIGSGKAKELVEELTRARDKVVELGVEAQKLSFMKRADELAKSTKELEDQADLLRFEATLIGKTNSERQKEIELYKIRKQLAKDIAEIERNFAEGQGRSALIADAINKANIETANVMARAHINAADEAAQAWQKTVDQVNQSLIDALMDGFDSGKSFAKNFRDTLVNMFKTLILRPIISPIVTGGVGGLANMFGLGGMGGAGGGGAGFSGLFGGALSQWLAGGATSIASFFGGGMTGLAGFFNGISSGLMSGLFSGINTGFSLMGGGSFMAGLGNLLPGIGQILGGIALIGNLFGLFDKSDPHVGATGWYETGKDPWNQQYQGDKYNEEIGAVVQDLAGAMGTLLQDFFTGFGLGDKDIRFGAGWVDDFDNSGPSFGDVKLYIDGEKFIDWQDLVGGSKQFSPGEGGYEEFVRTMLADVIDALASIEDLPSWAQDTLAGFDTANATVEQLAALLASIQQMSDVFQTWRESIVGFADYTNEAISALMEAAGGFESLAAAVSSYYANYYSEAEQVAMVQRQLAEALAEYGLELPRSKEDWRALVEEALAAGEEGADLAAALLGLSEAFAQAEDAAKQMLESVGISASSMSDIIRDGLIGRMSREDVGAALGDMVIGGMYNALYGGFADQITSIFVGGIVTPVIQAAMAGELLSTAISQESIRAVTQAALAAADALAQIVASPEWQAIMDGVNIAIGGITQVMRPAITSTNSYTSSVNSAASATSKAATTISNAWTSIIDSLSAEIKRLRGELLGVSEDMGESYYEAQFAILTAQARAGSQEAAEQLPEVVQALESIRKATAVNQVEVSLMQAEYLASLEETRRLIAAMNGISLAATSGTTSTSSSSVTVVNGSTSLSMSGSDAAAMRNAFSSIAAIEALMENVAATSEATALHTSRTARGVRQLLSNAELAEAEA